MSVQPIILVGPMPPPIDGQSMAFGLLARGLSSESGDTSIVNINRPSDGFARSRVARVLDYLRFIGIFLGQLVRHPGANVYLTVAQSRAGFVRDVVFIGLARLARRKIVIHVHGGNYDGFYRSQPAALRWLIRRILSWTSVIIVLAERLCSMFDFDPKLALRIHVVPNGLPGDTPPYTPVTPPREGEPFRVLFLSNLIESKGYLEVIEAAGLLVRSGIDIRLDLCGEFRANPSDDRRVCSAEQARRLAEDIILSQGLCEQVHLRGVVSGADKDQLLSHCHVLVLPTRYDAEGQPLAIIEAMAWGRPVITTDYRGIPDLVEDGVTGYLLATAEPNLIADHIRRLVSRPDLLASMGAASRARFEARFSSRAHLQAMELILRANR